MARYIRPRAIWGKQTPEVRGLAARGAPSASYLGLCCRAAPDLTDRVNLGYHAALAYDLKAAEQKEML